MILFLTSSPDGDLGSDNGGSPNGLDSRNGFAERLRDSVKKPAFFTLFAADPDAHDVSDHCAEYFAGALQRTGIPITGWAVCDGRNPDEAAALLSKSGVILLFGGHVPTQNAFFTKLGLRDLIRAYDGVIIGLSAGSMNSAETVYAQPEEPGEAVDPNYRRFLPGLGLTPYQILPHYEIVKDSVLDGMRVFEDITAKDSFGHCFYVLPDGSYLLAEGGHTTLYGEAWTFRDGKLEKFCGYGESRALD